MCTGFDEAAEVGEERIQYLIVDLGMVLLIECGIGWVEQEIVLVIHNAWEAGEMVLWSHNALAG